ncbi:hypothetical protein P3T27_005095 [Kitasatospora sp. MAA19]|uniref:hypothetical protein n=1 Tax=Kitasatospora sp. MAA19 TaxID=3035090 RepID=UPI00247444C1|nr:hypothetical protein [Kitasatospora sp. MAA19]MDH6708356.1 hypothetical protein [Kitasatospora sp. MAA19]
MLFRAAEERNTLAELGADVAAVWRPPFQAAEGRNGSSTGMRAVRSDLRYRLGLN